MSDQLPDAAKLIAENARLRKLAEQNEQAADALWAERDKLREALQGAVRCWETDLAMGHEVDRHYYRQAKAALQKDRDE